MKSIIYNKEKKRSTQRFMTFALVLALLLFLFNILTSRAFAGLFAPGSGVAEVNGEGYATLSEALSAWTEGSTLRLTSDVTTDSTINVPTGEHILDLNGYGIKMTGSGSVINIVGGANLRVDDSNEDALHRFNVSNAQSNGAGLATVDDSLTSGYKTFKGGYITGGNASSGGGILIASNAYLTLNGGTVIGNQSSWMGAGIKNSNTDDTEGKSFIMNGGSIIYNSISGWGSGVCSDSGVTINGGTIAYNYASKNPAGIHGHYIYINGGCIENNYSNGTEYASGVHSDHEVFISGDTVICGNLTNGDPYNLDWDRTEYKHGHMINITGALSDNAKIGVTMCISGTGQFTSGWKDNMGNAEPSKYFTSDKSIYKVKLNNGEAELVEPSLFDGSGTEEKPYLIRSVHDWNTLADSVLGGNSYADKCFKLTDDITVTRGIGGGLSSNDIVAPFSGTFDGGGHTLTVNIETGAVCAAPFFDVAGTTTIKNLRVDGYVKGGGHPGGLVGGATGTLKLENVLVTADVSGSIVGGIIGHGFVSDITMDSCAYTGNLQASNWSGGFLAWGGPWGNIQSRNNCTLSINNCLFAGSRSDSKNFHPIGLADGGGSCCNIISNSNTWSTLDTNTNSSIPTGDTSFRFTAATVTESKSSSRPWMGYFDVVDCLPVEGTYAYAVSAWSNGKILALLTDVNTPETTKAPSGTHTLDLNGYTLKAGSSGYSVITVGSGADLTIDDTSENNGKITGGSVGQNYGGGVTVDGGALTLKGGAISGNANTYNGIGNCGGGVHVRSGGRFYMKGGEISDNTSYVGGGICADSSDTTVSISGGVIKNNKTTRFGSAIWAGRTDNSVFRVCGDAQIIDNISTWTDDKDGEASINFKTLLISGDPTVHGYWKTSGTSSPNTHVNLDNDGSGIQRINIEAPLTNETGTANITVSPIYRWNDFKNGQTFEFTKNWSKFMGTAHPADFFKVDDSVSGVTVIRRDGEAAFTGSGELGDLYIAFDANGGNGTMDPQLATDTSVTLNENTFTLDDHDFVGWNTKADGSGTTYTDKADVTLTGDMTLYAQWEEAEDLFEGKGTEEEPYLIQSSDDWDALSEYINNGGTRYSGKNFKLTKSISVTTVIGNRPDTGTDSKDNPFIGTFDGDEHTLEVNINDPVFSAPFGVVHNSTIKNLKVTGTVRSSGNHASGLVAASKGRSINDESTLIIQNVTVSADISCNSHIAGIVGHAHSADITMENVVFDGSLSASSVQGGFIGWGGLSDGAKYTASFKDCLFTGTYRSSAAFYPVAFANGQGTVTLINDFYTISLGSGGSPITPTGDGQVRLLVATVEKEGKVKYYADIAAASSSENWTDGSTLRLIADATFDSTITVPSGTHTLDLNGYELKRTGATGSDNSGLAMTVGDGVDLTVTGPGRITGGKGFHGGGIHVEGNSSLVLDNCEVSGNTGHYGGGLYLKKGTITLKNGTVVKENSASEGYGGSGIYAEGGGTLIMDGCTFTGNAINNNSQYAVFLCGNANIKISGAPVIYDNTYSDTQKNLYMFQAGDQHSSVLIEGTLTDGMKIGVGQTTVTGEFTSGWKDNMGDADPSKYFTSDNTDYVVFMNSNGELEIGKGFVPDVSAEGFEGDYDSKSHSISVSVPDGATVKYGTQEGSYTLSENPTYTDAGTYKVYYEVSKKDYASVQGFAEVKIDQINATVIITGHNTTVDYDGKTHEVSGYDAQADSELYDVTKDFDFTGTAQAKRINADTTKMGLDAKQFKNKNSNFATVTFNVTDGYIKIDPIDVTVTITGHNTTVDYDGKTHEVSGYDAVSDSELYDVTEDFTYHGIAEAMRTNAGTTDMGLKVEEFENTNSNFKTVTFIVTDGYLCIRKVNAVITTAPRSREELVYNDSEQELIVAGTVEGGKLYYAIGSDSTSVPADSKFKDSLPVGKDVGNYYIWYKVIADFNHNSVAPACLKVTLAEEGWTTIKGIIHDADNNPVKGATVSLTSGGRTIDTIISESDGGYYFTAPAGVYNIVVNTGEATVTDMVDIFESKTYNVNISDANTDSVLDISDSDKDIVVGGLNKEADLVRAEEDISSDKNVSVRMTVTPVSVGSTEAVSAIGEYAADMNLEYYGFKVEKTVDSQTTYLDETQTVLEIVIPCSFTNKKELTVYNSDGTDVQSLTESNSGESGTFRVDKKSGLVYIYTDRITTYALGYKPYYSVKSYMTLGSFTGKVDVKLTKNGETVYELNDVSLDEVSFKGVSKGTYSMTVTWTDGAENTLTTPFKIK